MPMRTLFIVTLLFTISLTYGQKDPDAEPFLNKISTDLAPGHAVHLSFDYVREDLQAESSIEGSASLMLMGEKYKLELDEAIIFFDGEKQYTLNKEIEEVYISIPDPENKAFMFSDPIRLLRSYKEEFKYRLMGTSSIAGISAVEVQLYPEELGGPYSLLKLFFLSDKNQLKAIVIRQKDGLVYTMIVREMEQKETPDSDFFRFKAADYPNVDVIELLD